MITDQDIQIEKLFSADPHYGKTLADIYIESPHDPARAHQRLFVLLEVPRALPNARAIIDRLIERAVEAFERSRHTTPELTLEATLEALNMIMPELLPSRAQSWLDQLSILIGISDRGQVHFAQIGMIHAYHVHHAAWTLVSEKNRIENPLKIFSHITSGLLQPEDALIFTTNALIDYVSVDKIRSLVHELMPTRAILKLESLLSAVPSHVTFATVIVKFVTDESRRADEQRVAAEQTFPHSRETMNEVPPERTAVRAPRQSRYDRGIVKKSLRWFGSNSARYVALLFKALARIGLLLVTIVYSFFSGARRIKLEQDAIRYTNLFLNDIGGFFGSLRPYRRRLLLGIGIALFILLNGIVLNGQYQHVIARRSAFEDMMVEVSLLKQQADNAQVYNDDKMREQALSRIVALLSASVPTTPKQETQRAQYLEENETELNRLRHIIYVPNPLVAADFSSIGDTLHSIVSEGAALWAAGDRAVYRQIGTASEKVADAPKPIRYLLKRDSGLVALAADGTAYTVSDKALSATPFTPFKDQTSYDSVSPYANNLYALDAAKGIIVKYEGSVKGFKAGTVWMSDEATLSRAVSIAVDGNLYVTNDVGAILKFFKGSREDFTYQEPTPALSGNAMLVTSKDSNNLYLLDRNLKRVIIMDKQGSIVDQFTSPLFTNLTAIAINDSEDAVFVLNGAKVYALAIKK